MNCISSAATGVLLASVVAWLDDCGPLPPESEPTTSSVVAGVHALSQSAHGNTAISVRFILFILLVHAFFRVRSPRNARLPGSTPGGASVPLLPSESLPSVRACPRLSAG